MTQYVVTVKPDISVVAVATRMIAQDISSIVVVDAENRKRAIGIVTERDYIKKVPPSPSALKKLARDIMSKKLIIASREKTAQEVHAQFKEHHIRKILVTEDCELLGIITQTDLSQLALKLLKTVSTKKPLVKHWMTKDIISTKSTASFPEAKKLMAKKDIGAMVVKDNQYEGIFTEYDVVAQFYDQGGMLQIGSPKEIMHQHIKCIRAEENILFANRLMLEKDVRRLLVIEKNNVIGIITQTDIITALVEAAKETLQPTEPYIYLPKNKINSFYLTDNLKLYESTNSQ